MLYLDETNEASMRKNPSEHFKLSKVLKPSAKIGCGLLMGVSVVAASAAATTPPAASMRLSAYEESEDAAVRAFFQYQIAGKAPRPFCFNTSLSKVNISDLDGYKVKSILTDPPGKRGYAKDSQVVFKADWRHLSSSRVINTDTGEWRKMGGRQATFEECENLPSYKLSRVMIKGNSAIIVGGISYPCTSNLFGMNFKRIPGNWSPVYLHGYYAFGSSGCGSFSKSNPGERTDTFVMLGDRK